MRSLKVISSDKSIEKMSEDEEKRDKIRKR
jgi:hypothetical protein